MAKRWALVLASLLTACLPNRFDYASARGLIDDLPKGVVAVAVQDQREYVLNGAKAGHFVGLVRTGLGPTDAKTASGRPFARDVTDALERDLKAGGASVRAVLTTLGASRSDTIATLLREGTQRAYLLTIIEWKTDTGPTTGVPFHLKLEEFDPQGRVARTSETIGRDKIDGYYWAMNPGDIIRSGAIAIFQKRTRELFAGLHVPVSGPDSRTSAERLQQLQSLLSRGLITKGEFERKRQEILDAL